MITVIILWDNEIEKLEKTLESLPKRGGTAIRVSVWNPAGTSMPETLLKKYPDIFQDVSTTIAFGAVTVLRAGEYYSDPGMPEKLTRRLEEEKDCSGAIPAVCVPGKPLPKRGSMPGTVLSLRDPRQVLRLPADMRGVILRTEDLQGRTALQADEIVRWWNAKGPEQLFCDCDRVLFAERDALYSEERFRPGDVNAAWYADLAKDWKGRCEAYPEGVPVFLQAQIAAEIIACFRENKGNKCKANLTETEMDHFFCLCRQCLQKISDEILCPVFYAHSTRKPSKSLWWILRGLKYGTAASWSTQDFLPYVTLKLMEAEKGVLRLDCVVEQFVKEHGSLSVLVNGKDCPVQETEWFSDETYFGRFTDRKYTFAIVLPIAGLGKVTQIFFTVADGQKRTTLPIDTASYEAKISGELQHSYWCFDNYMVTLERGGIMDPCGNEQQKKLPAVSSIRIRHAGRASRMAQELRLMKEILRAPYGSKRMFAVRALYWLTYPVYGHKNIWVTFDKLYKGGDCGEYFYKYMRTRKTDGITPVYVIRKDVADYERLVREGCAPVEYQSLKQRLLYLHASMIFATHSAVHSFCGFSKWEVRFVQDRIRAVNTCIQHGLSVQDLTVDSNRIINNNKRYYCASKYEIENLSKPAYDYAPEVLRLTGLARYDGLVNRDQKQILIAPTWRAYIAMPPVMGSTRPYNPEFKQTDYFKIFQSLLENERLQKAAEEAGYRILFLLHPVISAQKDDFQVHGNVELLSAAESNYEKLLTEASLMVTDYSGIQFDFAYMRKPVVYFHPPKLPPHYVEGGFFYDTMGFGEICTETEQLVDTLIDYLQRSCALKEFYRARQDVFFAFDDHENCRRIFEDALEYQRKR